MSVYFLYIFVWIVLPDGKYRVIWPLDLVKQFVRYICAIHTVFPWKSTYMQAYSAFVEVLLAAHFGLIYLYINSIAKQKSQNI